MTLTCKCGGRFRRTDIRPVQTKEGNTLYEDTDPLKANWRCDKCKTIRTQRKRQPKK
jgi:hypothetical protein